MVQPDERVIYKGPTRWLKPDEVKAEGWACRGIWAWRKGRQFCADTFGSGYAVEVHVEDDPDVEVYYVGKHPQDLTDAPQGRTVERWVTVSALGGGRYDCAIFARLEHARGDVCDAASVGRPANVQRLILTVPEEPEICDVVGEVLP